MITRKIPENWLLPFDWVEQVYSAIGKRFFIQVVNSRFVTFDNQALNQEEIQILKSTVLSIREIIEDINV
jgi:hypothetical protein